MRYDKKYWRTVGIALLPALGVSMAVATIGRLFDVSDPVVDRVSQLLFFPTFLGMVFFLRHRRPPAQT